MRYFTFDWATGKLDDVDPVEEHYRFLLSLDPSSPVRRFGTTIGLQDAYLDRATFHRGAQEFVLLIAAGDLQVGYSRTELRYTGAVIRGESVLAAALDHRPSEIWYDEFCEVDGQFFHNFLLVPRSRRANPREFSVRFESFSFHQTPIEYRELATPDNRSVWS